MESQLSRIEKQLDDLLAAAEGLNSEEIKAAPQADPGADNPQPKQS